MLLVNKKHFVWLFFLYILLTSCENTGRKHNNSRKNVESTIVKSNRVVKILDGDTYDLLISENKTIRIRMDGIDAPEKGMPFGNKAKTYLGELCKGKTITVNINKTERFGRIISFSHLDNGELGCEMLEAGLAWHYKKYNSDPKLAELEHSARVNRKGLWVELPYVIPPWIVRRLNKKGYETQDIYKAQREHLRNHHVNGCPDDYLCKTLKEEN